jgi:hypothetical protein
MKTIKYIVEMRIKTKSKNYADWFGTVEFERLPDAIDTMEKYYENSYKDSFMKGTKYRIRKVTEEIVKELEI